MPVLYCTVRVATAVLANSQQSTPYMASKSHLEIYNFMLAARETRSSLEPFPRLPPEICEKIWRHSLQRERIVRVHLQALDVAVKGQVPVDVSPTGSSASHIAIAHGGELPPSLPASCRIAIATIPAILRRARREILN
jgi:2EXR family